MDLCLRPEIDIQFTWDQGALKSGFNYFTKANEYWIDGNCTVSGRLTLQALETLSQQKVWSPSIPLPIQTTYVKTYHHYTTTNIPTNDPPYYNAIGKALEAIYADAMKIAWNKLDPDELKVVKEDCDKIKSKKTF